LISPGPSAIIQNDPHRRAKSNNAGEAWGRVPHGCGNDAGAANCSAAFIQHELAMFDFLLNRDEEPVFTPADALRTATIQSARSMGVEEQFGSIRPGKVADLVVLEGDPLQDFHRIGKPVQALFMDGNLVINRCGLEAMSPIMYS
jgi:cytosine/adenosine deaminase-related metal-dependent hydrolase